MDIYIYIHKYIYNYNNSYYSYYSYYYYKYLILLPFFNMSSDFCTHVTHKFILGIFILVGPGLLVTFYQNVYLLAVFLVYAPNNSMS